MRWIVYVILSVLLILNVGCVQQKGVVDFVTVVHDHKEITPETVDALIRSIEADMAKMKESGVLTEDAENAAKALIARLDIIKRQSIVISDYVDANVVSDELLARLIRAKWNGE